MADTTDTTAAAAGHPPVPLLANSYDFQALLAAGNHATGLKKEENRDAALATLAETTALNQAVVEGAAAPLTPEGTEIKEVEGIDGRVVKAAVATGEPAPAPPPADDKKAPPTKTQD